MERYRLYHKAAVLSHDELLCVVAKVGKGLGGGGMGWGGVAWRGCGGR